MTQYSSKRSVLLGLIGQDIQASRTPEMQMREGEAQGLRLGYRIIDLTKLGLGAEALPELLTAAQRMGFNGLNITHPCKQAIIPHLDELSENARALGAVNTVILRDGRKIGENTDWSGFAEPFRRKMSDAPLNRVVQLGAGGAGAAGGRAALVLGVKELTIVDIDPKRAGRGAQNLSKDFGGS